MATRHVLKKHFAIMLPIPSQRVIDFERLAFGLFVHWGLYSQLGCGEWVQSNRLMSADAYAPLMANFTAKDFDADAFVELAKAAGMKYIVLTTRHHEGFSLYDTCGLSDFDAPHSPAHRDLVAEFVAACRRGGIVPFFYHTTLDWHWHGKNTVDLDEAEFNEYLDYLLASVEVLCRNYGKVGGFWFDGNWSRPKSDWKFSRLYGMIRRYQTDAMIVDNTGVFRPGEPGHPDVDVVTFENQAAKPVNREGYAKYAACEVCQTMNSHWGVGARDFNFKSPRDVIELLCHSRGCGANLLLNIGPEADGAIPAYEREVLRIVGRWVALFGEAIYETKPVTGVKCHGRDFLLQHGKDYYYFVFDLGIHGDANVTVDVAGIGSRCIDGFTANVLEAQWIDNGQTVAFSQNRDAGMLALRCNGYPYGEHTAVRVMKVTTA